MTTVSLANGIIQSSLVLAGALLLAWVFRRRSAALRHAIIATGVLCACATPLIRHLVPEWESSPVSGVIVLESSVQEPEAGGVAPTTIPPAVREWQMADVALAVWGGGAFLGLVVLGAGLFRLRQLRRSGRGRPGSSWRHLVHRETAAIALRRRVTVVEVAHPTFAATWGVVRPTVVVPSSSRDWTGERLGLVLAHELAHVRRRDWLVHIAAAVLQSICWFNPLAWMASRELHRLSEQACDDAVLGLGVDEAVYAGHLIDLARVMGTHRRNWMFAPAEAMARQSSLEGRVRAMMDTKLNRRPLGAAAKAVIVVALAALAVPAAALGVFGQGGPGSLAGILRDPQGRPVPNTALTLTQSGSATVHKAQTDAAGAFVFTGVPAGDYMFDPAIPGFMKQYPATVRPGSRTQLDITLRLGQVRETITVASRKGEARSAPAPAREPPPQPAYDPAADPCRKPGVSACIKPPLKLRDVRPVVPAGHEGEPAIVVIEGEIGVNGTIEGARLSKLGIVGQPAGAPVDSPFGKAALDAVNQWFFAPTRLNGEPVPTAIHITINFVNR